MNVKLNLSIPKGQTRSDIAGQLGSVLPKDYKIKSIVLPSKPGSGRRRGGKWELDFCKQLSLWWSRGNDSTIFKRAGSESTRLGGNVYGDVYAVKPVGAPLVERLAIELKAVKESRAETANLLCGKSPMFEQFWKQAVRQAEMGDRHPVLVVKIDRYCPIVFNLFDTLGTVRLTQLGRKVPLCILDHWFATDPEDFGSYNIFKQLRARFL